MRLHGEILRSALETTRSASIDVRSDGRLLGRVPRTTATMMARSGDYYGVGSPTRVRHLCQVTIVPAAPDPSLWEGRGVIRHWASQISRGMQSAANRHLSVAPDRPRKEDRPRGPEWRLAIDHTPSPNAVEILARQEAGRHRPHTWMDTD